MATNLKKINIFPKVNDLLCDTPNTEPNHVHGAYDDVQQYLSIHFNLIREDFMRPLREGIKRISDDGIYKLNNVRIQKDLIFPNDDFYICRIPKEEALDIVSQVITFIVHLTVHCMID